MNSQVRLQALSAFLKGQRAKISPESIGLPPGSRRRTPGLRRRGGPAGGCQHHLVHLARAGTRHPGVVVRAGLRRQCATAERG